MTTSDDNLPLWHALGSASPADRPRIRRTLMERYLPLCRAISSGIQKRIPVSFDDIYQSSVFGLANAIDAFDPTRGVKFQTYAQQRIVGSVMDAVRDYDWVPRLERRRNPEPTRMESLSRVAHRDINGGREKLSIDYIPDDIPDPSVAAELDDWWRDILAGLSRSERTIVTLYFREQLKMKQVGRAVGLSESRVSQMLASIKARLKAKMTTPTNPPPTTPKGKL